MKIVIPADVNRTDSQVSLAFGRAPYFAVYNTETCNTDFISNSAAESSGGAGIKAAQALVNLGAEAMISFRCGENAAAVLNSSGIKMFQAEAGSVALNVKLYTESRLNALKDIHPGFHGQTTNL